MATQDHAFPMKGTIGKITLLGTKDGHLAKENRPISAERLAKDPQFARTRENMKEFGTAGKAAQLLRQSLSGLFRKFGDKRVTSRLVKVLMSVIKSDRTNERGFRNVTDGNVALVEKFELNGAKQFILAFPPTLKGSIGLS
jgi:hypothetical protein